MKTGKNVILRCLSLAIGLTWASLCAAEQPIQVVTDIGALKSIVENIGANHVSVQRIIPENTDHHDVALRPSQIRALNAADLIVWVGPELTPALSKLLMDKETVQLSTNPTLALYDARDVQTLGTSHEHTHDHDDHGIDPHLWLSLRNVQQIANLIAQELTQRAPYAATEFEENLKSFLAELSDIDVDAHLVFHNLENTHYVAGHDSFQYFDQDYDLDIAAIVTSSDGHEVGPKTLSQFAKQLQKTPPACVLIDPREGTALARQLALDLDIPIVELDPTGDQLDATRNNILAILRETNRAFAACFNEYKAAVKSQ